MRIFRAYIITAIICISITAFTASVFIADENARKISLGEKPAVVVINRNEKPMKSYETDASPVLERIKEAVKRAASIAPPPVNNVYWIISNSGNPES